jgi:hypothetical protein
VTWPSTVAPVEIVWTTIMLAGLLIALMNLWYSWARLRALRNMSPGLDNEVRRNRATLLLRREGTVNDQMKIAGCFVCLSAIGAIALTMPPSPSGGGPLIGMIFVSLGVLLLWLTMSIRLRQIKYDRALVRD